MGFESWSFWPSPLFSKVRLSYDAISQCCWINQAAARQIDNTGRNNLATLLIACVNLQSGAGFLEGFGHSFNCGGTKGSLVGQVFTDRHRKKLLCCRVIAQAIFASKRFLRGRPFAIFLNDCSSHTGGDRGEAECGASAEGWRERPALALFLFSIGTRSARRSRFSDSGPLKPPSPSVAPVEAPRKRGFCFLGVVTPLLCAGRHIRNTRCRLVNPY